MKIAVTLDFPKETSINGMTIMKAVKEVSGASYYENIKILDGQMAYRIGWNARLGINSDDIASSTRVLLLRYMPEREDNCYKWLVEKAEYGCLSLIEKVSNVETACQFLRIRKDKLALLAHERLLEKRDEVAQLLGIPPRYI